MTYSITFRSYGACSIMLGPLGYKYFVPTGLKPFSSSCFVITDNSNTLTEHYLTAAVLDTAVRRPYSP